MLTATEARKLTIENTVKQNSINKSMLSSILEDIEKDAKNGGNFIFVDINKINEYCISELTKLGYTTSYEKAFTMLDQNKYKISW